MSTLQKRSGSAEAATSTPSLMSTNPCKEFLMNANSHITAASVPASEPAGNPQSKIEADARAIAQQMKAISGGEWRVEIDPGNYVAIYREHQA